MLSEAKHLTSCSPPDARNPSPIPGLSEIKKIVKTKRFERFTLPFFASQRGPGTEKRKFPNEPGLYWGFIFWTF
jgi:hypothetical protein